MGRIEECSAEWRASYDTTSLAFWGGLGEITDSSSSDSPWEHFWRYTFQAVSNEDGDGLFFCTKVKIIGYKLRLDNIHIYDIILKDSNTFRVGLGGV
jgi:hypothetical protein